MTPKEKALSLIQQFAWLGTKWEQTDYTTLDFENAKECALKCVEEKIQTCNKFYNELSFPADVRGDGGFVRFKKELDYFNEVKKEIENYKL